MKTLSSTTTMSQLILWLYSLLVFAWKLQGCHSLIAKLGLEDFVFLSSSAENPFTINIFMANIIFNEAGSSMNK